MNNFFYFRLALKHVARNKQNVIPYCISSIVAICLFFVIYDISYYILLEPTLFSSYLKFGLHYCIYSVAVCSAIILMYIHQIQFIQRKKEFGLYGVIGMNIRQMCLLLSYENLILSLFSLIIGILLGVVFSKLMFLVFLNMIGFPIAHVFTFSFSSILTTLIVFSCIFISSFIISLIRICSMRGFVWLQGTPSKVVEPKNSWVLATMGLGITALCYYMALSTQFPLIAIFEYVVVVILMIFGTYALFIGGIPLVLKWLRNRKKLYYKMPYFISISTMLQQFNQYGFRLSTICILSTSFLLIMPMTTSLYFSHEDILDTRNEREAIFNVPPASSEFHLQLTHQLEKEIVNKQIRIDRKLTYMYFNYVSKFQGQVFEKEVTSFSELDLLRSVYLISFDSFYPLNQMEAPLKEDEVIVWSPENTYDEPMVYIENKAFHVKKSKETLLTFKNNYTPELRSYYIIVANEHVIQDISQNMNMDNAWPGLSHFIGFDFQGNAVDEASFIQEVKQFIKQQSENTTVNGSKMIKEDVASFYSGVWFNSLLAGFLWLITLVLIMYYTLVGGNDSDRKRMQVMHRLGIEIEEIKQSDQLQTFVVFFSPVVLAILHAILLFQIQTKVLAGLFMTDVSLFVVSTLAFMFIFVCFYVIAYRLIVKSRHPSKITN